MPTPYSVAGIQLLRSPVARGQVNGTHFRFNGVLLTQTNGYPAAGELVNYSQSYPNVYSSTTQYTTEVDGVTYGSWYTTGPTPGTYLMTIASASVPGQSVSWTAELLASGLPAVLGDIQIFAYDLQFLTGLTNSTISGYYGTFVDQRDNALGGLAVTLEMINPPAGCVFQINGQTILHTLTQAGTGVPSNTQVVTGTVTGSFVIRAYEQGKPTGPRINTYVTVEAGNVPYAITKISGDGQVANVTVSFANALVAKVVNTEGTPLAGITVTFTAPASGASCSLSGSNVATAVTNASGLATSPVPLANATLGNYSVIPSCPGVVGVGFTLTNSAPAAPVDRNDCLTFCEA